MGLYTASHNDKMYLFAPLLIVVFWLVLDQQQEAQMPHIGCLVHANKFACEYLHYDMCLRMHFYSANVSKKFSQSKEAASARKQAKLFEKLGRLHRYKECRYCHSYFFADF